MSDLSDPQQSSERAAQPGDALTGPAPQRGADATTTSGGCGEAALVILCPYCHSQDVELLALFGAQLLTDQYYCNTCHTPFEHVRDA